MNKAFSFGNLDDVEARGDDIAPPGVYRMRSVEHEMKDTKNGRGSYLAVQFEIIEGAHEKRRVFVNFNLINENSKAVEIALRDIKSWIIACGLPATGALTMDMIDALEGKPFLAKVGIEKDKSGQYEDKNKISRFLEPTADQLLAQEPTPRAAPPTADRKPWEA